MRADNHNERVGSWMGQPDNEYEVTYFVGSIRESARGTRDCRDLKHLLYRLILLLKKMTKVMEKIMYNRLLPIIESGNGLSE